MKINVVPTLALLALLLSNPTATGAKTIHVPGDHATIQLGVWYAAPGDTVLVECGTYYENLIYFDKAVTLLSATGDPTCVTVDGEEQDHIAIVYATTDVVIAGFTFTNGLADFGGAVRIDSADVAIYDCIFDQNAAAIEGGGVWWRKGTPDIQRCDFTQNEAPYSAGGLCLNYTDGQVDDCWFMGNEARWGGGMACYHGATTLINDCTFEENDAVGEETYGGGLYTWDGTAVTVTTCGFFRNTSEHFGGGACTDTDCTDTYQSCVFYYNSAEWGGGMYAWGNPGGLVDGCSFDGNSAVAGGGALFEEVSGATLSGTSFLNNTADDAGGGLTLLASSMAVDECLFDRNAAAVGAALAVAELATLTVSSCTLVLNGGTGARTLGAGIAVEAGGSTVEVTQTVIAFSQSGEAVLVEPGSAVTLTTCDIFGNAGGDWVGSIAAQLALRYNTDEDPRICGVHEGNYALCADSPCLPANNDPGLLIGRYGQGCDACGSPVERTSWGLIKSMYR